MLHNDQLQALLMGLSQISNKLSDGQGCLTQLAKSRMEITNAITRMAINPGCNINGNHDKLKLYQEEMAKIDALILTLSKPNNA